MTLRISCNLVCRLAALFFAAGAFSTYAEEAARPNVILIVADDLPADMCNFAQQVDPANLTPNLDRLAAEGVVLSDLHSPSPVCTPSRFAILSGCYPSTCRSREFAKQTRSYAQTFVSFNTHLTASDETLPKVLRRNGYRTGAVGKNHVLEAPGYVRVPYLADPTDPQIQQRLNQNAKAVQKAFYQAGFEYAERLYHGNPDADGVRELAVHNQDWVTEGAVEFLAQQDARPFFLYMATTLPHGPFDPNRSWRADRHIVPTGKLDRVPDVQPSAESIDQRLEKAGEDRWNRGALVWLDDAIGRLVEELRRQGVYESTTIVFMSDHGSRAKGSIYKYGTRTPAFVWRKGGFAVGPELDNPLSLTDIMPTILDIAGVDASAPGKAEMHGKSFLPQMRGEDANEERLMYYELGFTRGVSDGRYKYISIRFPTEIANMSREERLRRLTENNRVLETRGRPVATTDPMSPFSHLSPIPGGNDAERVSIGRYPSYFEADQLFDVAADPAEQHNLANDPAYADTLRQMKAKLGALIARLPGDFPLDERPLDKK